MLLQCKIRRRCPLLFSDLLVSAAASASSGGTVAKKELTPPSSTVPNNQANPPIKSEPAGGIPIPKEEALLLAAVRGDEEPSYLSPAAFGGVATPKESTPQASATMPASNGNAEPVRLVELAANGNMVNGILGNGHPSGGSNANENANGIRSIPSASGDNPCSVIMPPELSKNAVVNSVALEADEQLPCEAHSVAEL